jgi:hypothetical protein
VDRKGDQVPRHDETEGCGMTNNKVSNANFNQLGAVACIHNTKSVESLTSSTNGGVQEQRKPFKQATNFEGGWFHTTTLGTRALE